MLRLNRCYCLLHIEPIENIVSALPVEPIRPYFGKKNMHDGEQRETNDFSILLELCHKLDI